MSQQGQDVEYDEYCENCSDQLIAKQNWAVNDIQANLLYCTKEECQQSKPEIITTRANNVRIKKKKPVDRGLPLELKPTPRYIKIAPDPIRVTEFTEYLKNPEMWNEQGMPMYSKIFKYYGIYDPVKGYEVPEMAAAQYPNEVDTNGCPSIDACKRVRNYLKSLTKRYKGNLEIYSTRVTKETHPYKGRRVWRWHTLKNREDLDKQTNDMRAIANNILLNAKERENNFTSKTFEERMNKVDLLNQFFE